MRPSFTREGAHLGHEMSGIAGIDSLDERPRRPDTANGLRCEAQKV